MAAAGGLDLSGIASLPGAPTCYDSNGNVIDCGTATSTSLCFDANQDEVDCSSYSTLANNNVAAPVIQSQASAVGAASASSGNGSLSVTSPASGGSGGTGLNYGSLAQSVASLANTVSTAVTGPPKTTLSLGASGLNISSLGSIFSNPLVLILLAGILLLTLGIFKKK